MHGDSFLCCWPVIFVGFLLSLQIDPKDSDCFRQIRKYIIWSSLTYVYCSSKMFLVTLTFQRVIIILSFFLLLIEEEQLIQLRSLFQLLPPPPSFRTYLNSSHFREKSFCSTSPCLGITQTGFPSCSTSQTIGLPRTNLNYLYLLYF